MLKYFAAMALSLAAIPAFADATGAGFCTVMQEEMTACIEEAAAKGRCPNAVANVKASYEATNDESNKKMRAELQNANAVWMGLAQPPARGAAKLKAANAAIDKSCAKLRKLDQ